MHTAQHDLLVATAQGDLCLTLTALREVDACLRSLRLTPQEKVALLGQVQRINQLIQRAELWLMLGEADLDEELNKLLQEDSGS